MPRILLRVFSKGDKACKWGYHSACTTYIDTKEKLSVIICKLRKQYGWGNVADKLATERRKNESVFLKKEREKIAYGIYSGHVSGENEEENKGKKQSVVNVAKSLSVKNQKYRGNKD